MSETFGHLPGGEAVQRLTLRGGGLRATILSYGAIVQDLRLDGHEAPLVLGLPDLGGYLERPNYFGATVGRFANRIAGGRFTLDGRDYQLDRNEGATHLHGGSAGFSRRLWQVAEAEADRARLTLISEDGEMGYPGRVHVSATFTLAADGVFDVVYEATAEAPTLVNLAHHGQFILGPDLLAHELRIDADQYLPVDGAKIPTGEVAPVAGTALDYRAPRPLGAGGPPAIDHNFCLAPDRREITEAARLFCPETGLAMTLRTTEPGLQVFDGHAMADERHGLGGLPLGRYGAIAMEPQTWPDSPNQPGFPQAVLRPGETYRQHTQYIFTKEATR